jgi:hypothetical protein
LEENVGIDRHRKIDTIGPYDKQGKIDALERYFGLPGFQGYGLARLVGLREVARSEDAWVRRQPHSRNGWIQ